MIGRRERRREGGRRHKYVETDTINNSQDCGGICTSPTGCTFGAVTYDYKNKFNLTAIGWDKYISSFECHLNETGVPTTPK